MKGEIYGTDGLTRQFQTWVAKESVDYGETKEDLKVEELGFPVELCKKEE